MSGLTVAGLIAELQKLPPDLEVRIWDADEDDYVPVVTAWKESGTPSVDLLPFDPRTRPGPTTIVRESPDPTQARASLLTLTQAARGLRDGPSCHTPRAYPMTWEEVRPLAKNILAAIDREPSEWTAKAWAEVAAAIPAEYGAGNLGVLVGHMRAELEALRAAVAGGHGTETQQTITAWANETFGTTSSNARVAARANEEMSELLRALTADDTHPKARVEIADIAIVLYRLATRLGADLHVEVDRKMAINRTRVWELDGTGHGYHVRDKSKPEGAA